MYKRILVYTFLSCLASASFIDQLQSIANAALVLQDFDPAKHDRFTNSPNFIGREYNWSGVGQTNGTWGTLISPSFVITATHLSAAVNSTIRFHPTNDPNTFIERTIVQNIGIPQTGTNLPSDLTLSRLSAPATGISFFPILDLPNSSSYINQQLFVFGLSNRADQLSNARLGRNQFDRILPLFSHPNLGPVSNDAFIYDFDNPGGVGADEAMVQSGDSGAPSFIIGPTGPALVGLHWFQFAAGFSPGLAAGSGDTFVSSFVDELNAAMALTGSPERVMTVTSVASVPEPSALLLVAAGICFLRIKAIRNFVRRIH